MLRQRAAIGVAARVSRAEIATLLITVEAWRSEGEEVAA